ncbi:MAG: cytidine deaminase [Coxiellaceae bacterium]|nr:cytidine deaminase [Coxiellaceae bacterium]
MLQEMINQAREARALAYAPYSNFQVGVCIRTTDDQLFRGCNVENAAYSVVQCAERSAIGNMVSTAGKQLIKTVVICSSSPEPCPPCGMCRQALAELGSKETQVICVGDNETKQYTLAELLPENFNSQWLTEDIV